MCGLGPDKSSGMTVDLCDVSSGLQIISAQLKMGGKGSFCWYCYQPTCTSVPCGGCRSWHIEVKGLCAWSYVNCVCFCSATANCACRNWFGLWLASFGCVRVCVLGERESVLVSRLVSWNWFCRYHFPSNANIAAYLCLPTSLIVWAFLLNVNLTYLFVSCLAALGSKLLAAIALYLVTSLVISFWSFELGQAFELLEGCGIPAVWLLGGSISPALLSKTSPGEWSGSCSSCLTCGQKWGGFFPYWVTVLVDSNVAL